MTKPKQPDDDEWGYPGFIEPAAGFDFDQDVEQVFGDPKEPQQHADYLALRSNVVGLGLVSPALSRFFPPNGAVSDEDEDILLAAIGSDTASSATRAKALQKLDYSAVARSDRLLRSKLTAWRFEVVLSVYAYSGITQKPMTTLIRAEDERLAALNGEDDDADHVGAPFKHWFDTWSEKVPKALRFESRRLGQIALWQSDGTMVGVEALPPQQWGARLDAVKRMDPWVPPKRQVGGTRSKKSRPGRPPDQ